MQKWRGWQTTCLSHLEFLLMKGVWKSVSWLMGKFLTCFCLNGWDMLSLRNAPFAMGPVGLWFAWSAHRPVMDSLFGYSALGLDTMNSSGDAALSLDAFCCWLPQLFEDKLPEKTKEQETQEKTNSGYLHALKSSPRTEPPIMTQYSMQILVICQDLRHVKSQDHFWIATSCGVVCQLLQFTWVNWCDLRKKKGPWSNCAGNISVCTILTKTPSWMLLSWWPWPVTWATNWTFPWSPKGSYGKPSTSLVAMVAIAWPLRSSPFGSQLWLDWRNPWWRRFNTWPRRSEGHRSWVMIPNNFNDHVRVLFDVICMIRAIVQLAVFGSCIGMHRVLWNDLAILIYFVLFAAFGNYMLR